MTEPSNLVLWISGKTDFAMVWNPKSTANRGYA
jgi:hypothetical protein